MNKPKNKGTIFVSVNTSSEKGQKMDSEVGHPVNCELNRLVLFVNWFTYCRLTAFLHQWIYLLLYLHLFKDHGSTHLVISQWWMHLFTYLTGWLTTTLLNQSLITNCYNRQVSKWTDASQSQINLWPKVILLLRYHHWGTVQKSTAFNQSKNGAKNCRKNAFYLFRNLRKNVFIYLPTWWWSVKVHRY